MCFHQSEMDFNFIQLFLNCNTGLITKIPLSFDLFIKSTGCEQFARFFHAWISDEMNEVIDNLKLCNAAEFDTQFELTFTTVVCK